LKLWAVLGSDDLVFGRTILNASSSATATFDSLTVASSASLFLGSDFPAATFTTASLTQNGHYDAKDGTTFNYSSFTWAGGRLTDSSGTIAVLAQNQDLLIPSSSVLTQNFLVPSDGQIQRTYQNITVSGTITHTPNNAIATGSMGVYNYYRDVRVATSGSQSWYGVSLGATGNFLIATGAGINVSNNGYGTSSTPGIGITNAGNYGAGGTYGGLGGLAYQYTGTVTSTYGNAYMPTMLGAAGGATFGTNPGSPGGGSVRLAAAGTFTLSGEIVSKAVQANACGAPGGGSGGSVWIDSGTYTGRGTIDVQGGQGCNQGAGGSGGRVAVYYTSDLGSTTVNTFGGTYGNTGAYDNYRSDGGSGTSILRQSILHLTVQM
jgi:hypothetical protein